MSVSISGLHRISRSPKPNAIRTDLSILQDYRAPKITAIRADFSIAQDFKVSETQRDSNRFLDSITRSRIVSIFIVTSLLIYTYNTMHLLQIARERHPRSSSTNHSVEIREVYGVS